MNEYHNINIAGLDRKLPLCRVNESMSIAAFVIFGDVELTIAAAGKLLEKAPDFDFIVTPEAKSIPLAYEMSRQSGREYFVARKGAKLYMNDIVSVNVRSITTQKEQTLYLDGGDGEKMRGKKVLIVDDVISTGDSLKAVEELLSGFDCVIAAKTAILAEGDAADRDDIVYLEKIPLFFK
ncbi:MAG: adenine phosphoribosyltransferase [Oscillospiraceae bacterium]|nr:adenine phosphoribosyltransferase [Oscillospiraceae bacterium]